MAEGDANGSDESEDGDDNPSSGGKNPPEAEAAKQFAKYGDLITAFSVVQAITFVYTIWKAENETIQKVGKGWIVMLLMIAGTNCLYEYLIGKCGNEEETLRLKADQSVEMRSSAEVAVRGRRWIVRAASITSILAVILTKCANL